MIGSLLLKKAGLLRTSRFGLNITKFSYELQPVLETAPVNRPPQIQSTTEREHYREQNKIRFKRAQQHFQ